MKTQAELEAALHIFEQKLMHFCTDAPHNLSWDEIVAGMGVVSAGLAEFAAKSGDGTRHDCKLHAAKRFEEGFNLGAVVTIEKSH